MNIKKGNVILVKKTVNANLSELSANPGAIKYTNNGMKISTIKTIAKRNKIKKLNTSFAKIEDFFFDLDSSEE